MITQAQPRPGETAPDDLRNQRAVRRASSTGRTDGAGIVVCGSGGRATHVPRLQRDAFGAGLWMLPPGSGLFGGGAVRATTLLGAGVAMAMWCEPMRRGGLCHVTLARDAAQPATSPIASWTEPLAWLETCWGELGCPLPTLQLCLAGAAGGSADAAQTLREVRAWAAARQIDPIQEDVGGRVMRRLTMNLGDGAISIAHGGRLVDAGD